MRPPQVRFTVRRLMILIAGLAFLLLALTRCGPPIVLANYHAEREEYHRDRLAWFVGLETEGGPELERWRRYADYHTNQAAYHAHLKSAFRHAIFRPWERLPIPQQESVDWRPQPAARYRLGRDKSRT
jgi:hypothetical protein